MARIAANSERVYRIQRWRGVNEAPEGDASLELGEAASMRNFKVTAAGALQKRGGSANAAGLLSGYTTALAEDTATLYAELGTSYLELELYPGISADDMGELSLTGDAETVTLATAGAHEGWYLTNGGRFYRFEGVAVPEAGRYEWEFRRVTAAANTTDTAVRGLWSGFVAGQEVLCAACNGYLWQLSLADDGTWSKTACGTVDTDSDVFMFGFGEKLYLLNGSQYRVWDGSALTDVAPYRPLVAVGAEPDGGGTALEQINKLTGARRIRFSPDGTATRFYLPEHDLASVDYVRYTLGGEDITGYTADTVDGVVTISPAPEEGTDSIEIGYTASENTAGEILAMRCAELFNGSQDTRVFVYGDGSNRAFYTGLDTEGVPRADYFPELNAAHIGDANTPVTAMIRHYDRLLAFKPDSAWSIGYSDITLADGSVTAGFYISPVNRSVGCCALGQAQLVENRPRTLDAHSVVEWRSGSAGNISGDERNAVRVSQRAERTLRTLELESARTFYDKFSHEYYVIGADGTAVVQNMDADAWYVYTGFPARCLINYRDELYFGTADGYLRHFSSDYLSDEGEAIDAYWESGAMSFTADFQRKYSAMLWVGIRPEEHGRLAVTARTDRADELAEYAFALSDGDAVPETARLRLKARRFTYYKLILSNDSADSTATVVSVDIRVRGAGYVR